MKNLAKITFKTFILFWILVLPINLVLIGTATKPIHAADSAPCTTIV